MKGILIDPSNKSVSNVEYDGNYKSIAPMIGAGSGLFCFVNLSSQANLYLDDEGLLVNPNPHGYFRIGRYPQVLAGKGLVLGVGGEDGDEDADVLFPASWLASQVEFIDDPAPEEIEPKIEVMPLPPGYFGGEGE